MQGNLFAGLEHLTGTDEQFDELLQSGLLRVERIVSTGQASPPDFWYDQEQGEWVVLLSGSAELQFEDDPEPRRLDPGDWVNIAPHRRHRVNWTDPGQPTVWLAVHYSPEK
ncbi:MAG: cupin domain-containing protein [Desulfobulbus sp.]|nr:cupin domain-containing protein [Desulfobulbus sp.]